LLAILKRNEEQTCGNARLALASIWSGLEQDEAHQANLLQMVVAEFPQLSAVGQRCVLALTSNWLQGTSKQPWIIEFAANLVRLASQTGSPELRSSALELSAGLLAHDTAEASIAPCREFVRICLKDADAGNRERAVRLTLYPSLNLLDEVAPLLRDPDACVRRAAILAVGNSRQAISDENLALALHDSDADVRRLCEKALRGRGLTTRHIQLARLITDTRAATRMQVLFYLQADADLDVAQWLRLLSHDRAEAVRAAAIRSAAEQEIAELNGRIEEMAQRDPSPTVCQLAGYYLARIKQTQARRDRP
jgi:HEAT repeat protein